MLIFILDNSSSEFGLLCEEKYTTLESLFIAKIVGIKVSVVFKELEIQITKVFSSLLSANA